jgi:uncharacterized membrane protein
MDYATLLIVFLTGFTACVEFGSFAFVHPILRRLPQQYHIEVEQGLLTTFGRIMPVLMTLCVIAPVAYAIAYHGSDFRQYIVRWIAAVLFILALIFTLIFNVPINLATARWDPSAPPDNWKATRNKWEFCQGIRSWLLLLGFLSVSIAVSFHHI